MSIYHDGELAVQEQAGVQRMAGRISGMIRDSIPFNMHEWLNYQPMVIVGAIDEDDHIWAHIVTGEREELIHVLDRTTLTITADLTGKDALVEQITSHQNVGMLFIDLEHRSRVRVNGNATVADGVITVTTTEVYGNCQKYIQSRELEVTPNASTHPIITESDNLSDHQVEWLQTADTFFIASAHPSAGADVSHRGGMPGFVQVEGSDTIVFPDYSGNMMFNTLSNIAANPNSGLLFIDFDSGSVLQLSGQATVIWDEDRIARFTGAERLVEFKVEQVIESQYALPIHTAFREFSAFNPR